MTVADDPRLGQPVPRLDHIEVWVFDLDNTLYSPRHNLFAQIDRRMGEFVSDLLGASLEAARQVQKSLFREHGSTLRGLMEEHGIAPDDFLDYVHDVDLEVLPPDAELDAALGKLDGRKLIFTSASLRHAERVTARLGVDHHFEDVYDIAAADYLPKPHRPTYERFLRRHQVDPGRAVMFDDIARNLEPAAALGMTTVWIPGRTEWAREGSDGDHIDYVAADLAPWLAALVDGEERG
ncbi:MAG: pyrimidine 5'-nucleotidase [Alphaproteobacteria bacterium]|nr:pyrimidine 5'-nucleotidase [Alphaproteobacteria bacterium]